MVYLHRDLQGHEFNFHEISMKPRRIPGFPRNQVDLKTRAARNLELYMPLASAPMDTVTEYEMAVLLELNGGLGVLHYNSTVDYQIEQLKRVKNYKSAFVRNPVCLRPDSTVHDVYDVHNHYGFYSVPITEDGTPQTRLLGFVSYHDIRYQDNRKTKLRSIMTPRDRLIVAAKKDTVDRWDIKTANMLMKEHNLNVLTVVDNKDRPYALVTDRDIRLHEKYPHASVDDNKQLLGFIAIKGDWHDKKRGSEEQDRIYRAAEAGADGIVIDQGVVYGSQPEIVKWVKKHFPEMHTGVGNVCCGEVVEELMGRTGKFIDFIKVGVGPGMACTTTQELAIGRAQPAAVYDCARTVKRLAKRYGDVPIWADGGVKKPGDATLDLALGATVVMVGGILAGYEEAPGRKIDKGNGVWKKEFRGMGSMSAMKAGGDARYSLGKEAIRVVEGREMEVPYKGDGEPILIEFVEGIKQAMNKLGFRTIDELQRYCMIIPNSNRQRE